MSIHQEECDAILYDWALSAMRKGFIEVFPSIIVVEALRLVAELTERTMVTFDAIA